MKKIIQEQFDVLVIGGGAAGLMAAGRAAEKGARVALVEKNDRYGIKLLMTGNGRCNLTQNENNVLELIAKYKNGRFLLNVFQFFGPKQTREFFAKLGLETKVEKDNKVYPASDQSKDVVEVLYQYCRENMVTFFSSEEVIDVVKVGNCIEKVITKKKEISAKRYILATGGKSYVHTGSSGQGFMWAAKLGHKVTAPKPVLTPIKMKDDWLAELQGVSGANVAMTLWLNGKKKNSASGDLMFAHYGLSGPLALNMSRQIEKLLGQGQVKVTIDLKPYLTFEQLDEIVRKDFERKGPVPLANCLGDLFTPKLLNFLLKHSGIDVEKHAANISKKERQQLVRLFKALEMQVDSLFGFEKAMVTSGGVSIKEIDSKTMQSKVVENLFLAGEVIDVDGPTGGYNLHIAWATGFKAGENAAK